MTIRQRLALAYAGGVAVTVAVVGAVVWWQMAGALRAGLAAELAAKADAVATSLENNGQVGLQEADASGRSLFVALMTPSGVLVDATANAPAGLTATAGDMALGGRRYLVRVSAAADGTSIVVGADLAPIDGTLRSLEGYTLTAAAAAGALSLLAGWWLSGRALAPLRRLADDAARIGPGALSDRLTPPTQADEVGRLADTLNEMLDRIAESVSRQRRFVAMASHELRTPLAALRAELDLADDPGNSRLDLLEAVHTAQGQAVRLTELSSSLLSLASVASDATAIARSEFDVADLAQGVARSAAPLARQHGVEIRVEAEPSLVTTDRVRLELAIGNLVRNAIVHGASGGTVDLTSRVEAVGAGGMLTVEVADRGPGFAHADPASLFEPFARGVTRAPGSGLGLATVAEAVNALRGDAGARNRPGGGAVAWVSIPVGTHLERG